MSKHFFDYDDGDFAYTVSDNMAIDSDGNMMMRMGDNMACGCRRRHFVPLVLPHK